MNTNKVLVLGDGLLGSELVRQTGWDYVSRKKDGIDFTQLISYYSYILNYDVILNAIGSTDTYSKNLENHWKVNFEGVVNLVDACVYAGKKLCHISTDYLYSSSHYNASETTVPVHAGNWYSYTKLLGDGYVQLKMNNYLLVRTSFKKRPFPHKKAMLNLRGNFEYVDEIATKIINLVNFGAIGLYNVGGIEKSMYDLAQETVPDVEVMYDSVDVSMPTNVTMNLSKLHEFERKYKL